ncbi:MAG TPA: glycosyl hydrolase family 28-related protein, partial [Steroidobacteraceae bacterium]|nr:glycosyl hydrolase family 28-related protein [Steroidobacteraceae bacterium]
MDPVPFLSPCPGFRLMRSLLFLSLFTVTFLHAEVVPHGLPADYPLSNQAAVRVNGTAVPVLAHTALYDYCHFSADGALEIAITASEAIRSWSISPLALNLPAKVSGRTLTFTIPRATYLIVKLNALREIAIAGDPAERDAPVASGSEVRNVQAAPYTADATGRAPATAALQQAIDDAHAAGSGIVYVPAGLYVCGNLTLRSHVSLYLASGAVLKSSGNPQDFTTYYRKNSLGMD